MKTNLVRHCTLGLAAGLTFFLGCARPAAQPEQPAVLAPAVPAVVASGPVSPGAPASTAAATAESDTNAPAIVERIPASAQPENVSLSPGLSEVVKLAQAGVGEEVILAYVDKYSGRFEVGADQILYLNDLGVSGSVITSMLKHDGVTEANVAAVATNAAPLMPVQPGEQPPPAQVATSVAPPPPTSTEVSYFYDTLSPYGSWVYLSGYGWCWQPTVAVSVSTWRPYCDRGRWYWSDAGWYWHSDYSWGWAAFHYGRWYQHPRSGWVWAPGTVWAPSWVSWRYSDGYCGWAPLPPEAHFVSGVGFSFHGRHVSVGFEFGLRDYHYSFVRLNNFCDYAPYRYVVPHTQVRNFYRNTTVINNYIVGNNNTVINRGLGRDTIARASTTRVRDVSVRETQVQNLSRVRGDRIERQGNQTVVYRPQLPKTPPAVRTAQFVSRSGGQSREATAGVRGSAVAGSARTSGEANVTTTGPSRAGNGRAQTGVATRSSTGGEAPTPQSPREERQNRNVVSPRGNANGSVERGANAPADRGTVRNPQPATRTPQVRQQQQPRANAPLFGSGTASTSPQTQTTTQPQNNAPTRNGNPAGNGAAAVRGRQQIQQNNAVASPGARAQQNNNAVAATPGVRAQQNNPVASPGTRAYPQGHAQAQAQQPARTESRTVVRGQTDHSTMSPRGYEQAPRYNVPAYQAPQSAPSSHGRYSAPQAAPSSPGRYAAPQHSAPSVRSAPSGGRSEVGPSRVERSERNR